MPASPRHADRPRLTGKQASKQAVGWFAGEVVSGVYMGKHGCCVIFVVSSSSLSSSPASQQQQQQQQRKQRHACPTPYMLAPGYIFPLLPLPLPLSPLPKHTYLLLKLCWPPFWGSVFGLGPHSVGKGGWRGCTLHVGVGMRIARGRQTRMEGWRDGSSGREGRDRENSLGQSGTERAVRGGGSSHGRRECSQGQSAKPGRMAGSA